MRRNHSLERKAHPQKGREMTVLLVRVLAVSLQNREKLQQITSMVQHAVKESIKIKS